VLERVLFGDIIKRIFNF